MAAALARVLGRRSLRVAAAPLLRSQVGCSQVGIRALASWLTTLPRHGFILDQLTPVLRLSYLVAVDFAAVRGHTQIRHSSDHGHHGPVIYDPPFYRLPPPSKPVCSLGGCSLFSLFCGSITITTSLLIFG